MRIAVELEAVTFVLLAAEQDDGDARANLERGDLLVTAKILEVWLAVIELPDGTAVLSVLVAK